MTFPKHWLLAFGGHQGHAEESWQCGIRIAAWAGGPLLPDPTHNMDEEQYLTDTAVPALTTWFGSAAAKIFSGAKLKWVKFNEIGPNGGYAETNNTHERLTLDVAGGVAGATGLHPLQICCCITWHTDAADRGPASIGRIYSPRPMLVVDVNGDVASGDRASVAGAAKVLLESLDVSMGVPPAPVARPAIVSAVGTGSYNMINSISVDSQLDIQHRRARSASREKNTVLVAY